MGTPPSGVGSGSEDGGEGSGQPLGSGGRVRHLLSYVAIVGFAFAVLAIALPLGERLESSPSGPDAQQSEQSDTAVTDAVDADATGDEDSGRGRPVFADHTVVGIVGLMLIGAWTTEEIGIHAIFGAFLVGVVVPRSGATVEILTSRLQDVTQLVLLPLFFVAAGMSTEVGLLDSAQLWGVTALVIVLAVVGKWGGSAVAARVCGLPWREASGLGVLMNSRGITEIVIASIGLELGIISQAVFTLMVLMALVTTAMTVPLLRWLGIVPSSGSVDAPVVPPIAAR